MQIIVCDFCKKELTSERGHTTTTDNRFIDLCDSCYNKYQNFEIELSKKERTLKEEYDKKRRKIYEDTVTKYGFDLTKDNQL